jgi:hypothetical protein
MRVFTHICMLCLVFELFRSMLPSHNVLIEIPR